MRSFRSGFLPRCLSLVLIFAVLACSQPASPPSGNGSSGGSSPGSSPRSSYATTSGRSGAPVRPGLSTSPLDEQVARMLKDLQQSWGDLSQDIDYLVWMTRGAGTRSVELPVFPGDIKARKPTLASVETDLRTLHSRIEYFLSSEAGDSPDAFKEMDRKLVAIEAYLGVLQQYCFLRAYSGDLVTRTLRDSFALHIPFGVFMQLTGFKEIRGFADSNKMQPLLFEVEKLKSVLPASLTKTEKSDEEDSSNLSMVELKFRGRGEGVYLTLSDSALAGFSGRALSFKPDEKSTSQLLGFLAVIALASKWSENRLLSADMRNQEFPLPAAIVQRFPLLAGLPGQLQRQEERYFDGLLREALLTRAPIFRRKIPKAGEFQNSMAEPPVGSNPEKEPDSSKILGAPAGGPALTNGSPVSVKPGATNGATNKVVMNVPATAVLVSGSLTNNAGTNQVNAALPLTLSSNTLSNASSSNLVSAPKTTTPNSKADSAKPGDPTVAVENTAEVDPELNEWIERQLKRRILFVDQALIDGVFAAIKKSQSESKNDILANPKALLNWMERAEHTKLRVELERVLYTWPESLLNAKDEVARFNTLRALLAKAKAEAVQQAFDGLQLPADILPEVERLKLEALARFEKLVPAHEIQNWWDDAKEHAVAVLRVRDRKKWVNSVVADAKDIRHVNQAPASDIRVDYPTLVSTLNLEIGSLPAAGALNDWLTWIQEEASYVGKKARFESAVRVMLKRALPDEGIRYSMGQFVDGSGKTSHAVTRLVEDRILQSTEESGPAALARSLLMVGKWLGLIRTSAETEAPMLGDLPLSKKQVALYRTNYENSKLDSAVLSVPVRKKPLHQLLSDPKLEESPRTLIQEGLVKSQENIIASMNRLANASDPAEIVQLVGESTLLNALLKLYPEVGVDQRYLVSSLLANLKAKGWVRSASESIAAPNKVISKVLVAWLVGWALSSVGKSYRFVKGVGNVLQWPWKQAAPQISGYMMMTLPFVAVDLVVTGFDHHAAVKDQEKIEDFFETSSSGESFYKYSTVLQARQRRESLGTAMWVKPLLLGTILLGTWMVSAQRLSGIRNDFRSALDDLQRIDHTGTKEITLELKEIQARAQAAEDFYVAQRPGATGDGLAQIESSIRAVRSAEARLKVQIEGWKMRHDKVMTSVKEDFEMLGVAPEHRALNAIEADSAVARAEAQLTAAQQMGNEKAIESARQLVDAAKRIRSVTTREMQAFDTRWNLQSDAPEAAMQIEFMRKHFFWAWQETRVLPTSQSLRPMADFTGETRDFYAIVKADPGLSPFLMEERLKQVRLYENRDLLMASARGDASAARQLADQKDAIRVLSHPELRRLYDAIHPDILRGAL